MDTNSMQITVPSLLKPFVEEATAQGGFSTADEFVASLIEAEQRRKAMQQLEQMALDAIDSGPSIEGTPGFWEERRRRVVERFGTREPT